jgi:hypothetical protein
MCVCMYVCVCVSHLHDPPTPLPPTPLNTVSQSLEEGVVAAITEVWGQCKVLVAESFEDFYDVDWMRRF